MGLPFLPILLGLLAAFLWGAGDFTGGLASRRANVYGVVVGGEIVGLVVLVILLAMNKESLPSVQSILLDGLAGMCGGFGLTLLYRGMASGLMSIVAPLSAVLAAVLPVITGAMLEGLPGAITLVGMLLALAAIWLISSDHGESKQLRARVAGPLRLGILAGIFFGMYFILIHLGSQQAVLWPIIIARLTSTALLSGIALFSAKTPIQRISWLPPRSIWPMVALNGLLDTGGNGMFILAGQLGRLDIAAVLSSLFPGLTVLLAWLILKERINHLQTAGILLALTAIVLITL